MAERELDQKSAPPSGLEKYYKTHKVSACTYVEPFN